MEIGPLGRAHGVVVPVPVDPAGVAGPTRRAAAGPEWRRSSRGLYVPAHVDRSPAQRVAEVGALVRSSRVAVTGWGARAWLGARWPGDTTPDGQHRPVDLVSDNRSHRPQPLFRLREEAAGIAEARLIDGLRLVPVASAVCFSMRHAPCLEAAVEVLDMAYADDLVTPADVLGHLADHPHLAGAAQARAAWELGDENVWSPQEVVPRLRWEAHTGRRPLTNCPVFDLRGHHLGTPDLLDPVTGTAGEYEGDHHRDRAQRRRDLAKEQRLRAAGLETFVVVAGESGSLLSRLREAEVRAARLPVAGRGWTLEQPHWWVPTHTVALRRALDDGQRRDWHPARIGSRRTDVGRGPAHP